MSEWDNCLRSIKEYERILETSQISSSSLIPLQTLILKLEALATNQSQIRILRRHKQILAEYNAEISDDGSQRSQNEQSREIDRILDIAEASRREMSYQHGTIGTTKNRVLQAGQSFPGVKSVLQSIRWKKRKDAIFLGLFIALLVFLIVIYRLNK